jgi:hypothetical protein
LPGSVPTEHRRSLRSETLRLQLVNLMRQGLQNLLNLVELLRHHLGQLLEALNLVLQQLIQLCELLRKNLQQLLQRGLLPQLGEWLRPNPGTGRYLLH